ncbi:hypothetical protein Pta02_65230 [Planobispora takensis]|uniref:Uncharacterized protein n=2 Tax=Planobispora takensis TaxID=1367882 RepID=A0A8J3T5I7_9ACTN|nr:hypothetical protein Pta02_65230 [Planobispora takensis]
MLPYFVIKIFWTVEGLRGGGLHGGAWSTLNWAAINGMTVGMAGVAILLGLALGRRWGERIPAWLLLLPAWIGMGFLVSMIPLLPASLLPAREDWEATESAGLPSWELPLIGLSFTGFALGLAVAAPIYARQRWPAARSSPGPWARTSPVSPIQTAVLASSSRRVRSRTACSSVRAS